MKKLVSLFLSLVMVGAVLCGCGGGSSQGDEGSNGVQNERKANNEIVVAIAQDLKTVLTPTRQRRQEPERSYSTFTRAW